MHKLLPRAAASFLNATAAAPLLLFSPRLPPLRLAGPLLAARLSTNPSRLRTPPCLRCDGARRGLSSGEAERRGDDAEEEKQRAGAVPERRQRARSDAPIGCGELLAIPGVGPRNLRKLVDKGFDGVAQLKQLYRDKVYA